ncbi:MAG: glycoside hydrolase family 16 protein [Halioglobus sp.]|nr:glycoside hydrolase family 16 protein [Halioglobus sp.]
MYKLFKRLQHGLVLPALTALIVGCGGGGGGAESPKSPPFYPEPEDEWTMVWSDEFDGSSLDLSNWDIQEGDGSDYGIPGWGNNELQWYQAENISVVDGLMTISARTENVGGYPYTSARIRTFEKFDFTYGRIEARIQAAPGQGLWSAFWMLPTNSPYTTWAAQGEVDIMEVVNPATENERTFATVHYGFPWPLNQAAGGAPIPADDPSGEFNEYAVEWSNNELRWYVNGEHYQTVTKDTWYSYYYADQQTGYVNGAGAAPFDVDFHILLNLAVGGNLPGAPDAGSIPSDMVIDYVRVFSCSYDQDDGVGCNSNADRTLPTPDAQEPFEDSFDLYTDAAGTIPGRDGSERELAVNSFWNNEGSLVFSEVSSGDADRGTVIDVQTSNSGNISINPVDEDAVELYGMGNNPNFWELHAAELKFDIYVDSASTDSASSLLIKMDSGYPAVGFVDLKVADLPSDQWTTISVKLNDIIASRAEGLNPINTKKIVSLFVFEPTSSAHVQLDNIELACGHPTGCGIRAPGDDGGLPPDGGPPKWEGTWRIRAEAGSLRVGPEPGDGSWWAIDDAGVVDRACYYNDDYIFGTDGSFQNVLGEDTWLEPWQGVDAEQCGAPVFPHDGLTDDATWSYDEGAGTLTIDGYGAYAGLPKAVNGGELPAVAIPTSVTYNAVFGDSVSATLSIESGDGVWWTFELIKTENVEPPEGDPELAGTWRVALEEGALGVGPEPGDGSWWAIDEAGLVARECYFDDDYVFGTDGTFQNVLGDDTWLEPWQGVDAEQCGTPEFPHDGMNDATWSYDEGDGTLTLDGFGAYLGLPKAVNDGELAAVPVPTSVTYTVTFEDNNTLLVNIEAGDGVWWSYKLVKVGDAPEPPPIQGTWAVASEAGSLAVGPEPGDGSWWAIDDAGLTARACYFDDAYAFNGDGTFNNILGDDTWLEPWQGVDAEQCGEPVFPHDGVTDTTWSYDEGAGTLTLDGFGSYLGLPKAVNDGELPAVSVPTSITYNIVLEDNNRTMIVSIEAGDGVFWTYKLVKN